MTNTGNEKDGSKPSITNESEEQSHQTSTSHEMNRFLLLADVKEKNNLMNLTKLDIFNGGISHLPNELPQTLPKLQTLFLMKNKFATVPAIIGSCKHLDMVSFKSNQIQSIDPDALQSQMRWLILTNNQITSIPSTIGRCSRLQKFMLSGNQIASLPQEIECCENLELIRIASNKLQEPPMSLLTLPNLGWIALSDNPFLNNSFDPTMKQLGKLHILDIPDDVGDVLGKGASGVTRKVPYQNQYVAVKQYSSEITSDGNPFEERRATLAASVIGSPCIVPLLGQNQNGSLIMKLITNYFVLGNPPSMKSCTRDVYDDTVQLTFMEAIAIATKLANVLAQLHDIGLSHGDFYSHNIIVTKDDKTDIKLTDFGAAFFYDKESIYGKLVQKIEMRAFGHFVEELIMLVNRGQNASIPSENCLHEVVDICLSNNKTEHHFVDLVQILQKEK